MRDGIGYEPLKRLVHLRRREREPAPEPEGVAKPRGLRRRGGAAGGNLRFLLGYERSSAAPGGGPRLGLTWTARF